MLVFSCYHCGLITDIDESMAGKSWRCPACRQAVTIPANRSAPRTASVWRDTLASSFDVTESAHRPNLNEATGKGVGWSVILVLLGLVPGLLLGGAVGYKLGRRGTAGETAEQPLPADNKPDVKRPSDAVTVMDAGDLYDCYGDKPYEKDSDRVLRDRVILITGVVSEKNDGRSGGVAYVGLYNNEKNFTAVKCYFENEKLHQVGNVSKLQRVRVKGVCKSGSSTAGVTLDKCEIVE